jgi:hypothetical protein
VLVVSHTPHQQFQRSFFCRALICPENFERSVGDVVSVLFVVFQTNSILFVLHPTGLPEILLQATLKQLCSLSLSSSAGAQVPPPHNHQALDQR